MHIPPENKFADCTLKLASLLQPWSRRPTGNQQQANPKICLEIPCFDAENEHLFWQESKAEILTTLKLALLLGATGFLAFIVLDLLTKTPSTADLIIRLQIVIVLSGLFFNLQYHENPIRQIARTAKLGAGFSIFSLVYNVLTVHNPHTYSETWTGLLPIYFFIYGQLFMTIAETVLFGWLAMLVLPLSAYMAGIELTTLIPSILILLLVNLFGFCTRWQLENHSRTAFLAKRKAETAAQNKTIFLQYLSHNLRQPLQTLCCYSSLLDATCAEFPGSNIQHIVGKLGYTIDELNKAFNNILHIANLENGKQQPLLKATDINLLLSALEDQFAPQAEKRNLKLKVHLRSQPPYNVLTDSSILSQIISNLIDNAIKYTLNGWIIVSVVKIGKNRLKLHVCDNGIGITKEQSPNIFTEFYRAPHRRNDPVTHGLGIGLAYVQKAVNNLADHSLKFYSKPNFGSDFQLILPVAECPNFDWRPGKEPTGIAGRLIFIVDDDLEVLEALAKQLSCCGCLVQTASSKAETLAALVDFIRPPDLLITDFYLSSKETAHDIIETIFKEFDQLPVLILSAHAISDEDKAKLPTNVHLLRKPANAEVLMEMIAKSITG